MDAKLFATLMLALLMTAPLAVGKPVQQTVQIDLELSGIATRTDGSPDPSFTVEIHASGTGTRSTPKGNGVQIRANDLVAQVFVFRTDDGAEVVNFTAKLGFHAQQASSLAQGLPAGNFKFNMGLHGDRGQSVVANNASQNSRILSMNAKGDTMGEGDDDGFFAVTGRGQVTTKPSGGTSAAHWNLELGGHGRIAVA